MFTLTVQKDVYFILAPIELTVFVCLYNATIYIVYIKLPFFQWSKVYSKNILLLKQPNRCLKVIKSNMSETKINAKNVLTSFTLLKLN